MVWHQNYCQSKTSSSSTINKIKDKDGVLTSDSTKIANIFNDYFVNVADQITQSIPRKPKSPIDYLRNQNPNSIFLTPVTNFEIEDIITNIDISKSVGPNSIPIKLLLILGPFISHSLAQLVKQSFHEGFSLINSK